MKRPFPSGASDAAQVAAAALLAALFLKAFVLDAVMVPSRSMESTLRSGDVVLVNKLAYGAVLPFGIFSGFRMPGLRHVGRGDVIVFRFPGRAEGRAGAGGVEFVKRCAGVAGDVVSIAGGVLIVNGTAVPGPGRFGAAWHGTSGPPSGLFPPGSPYTLADYGPLHVPARGDIVQLDSAGLPLWRSLIESEGHRVGVSPGGMVGIDGEPARTYTVGRDYLFVLGDNFYSSFDSRYWGFVAADEVVGEAALVCLSWDSGIRLDRVGTIVK